MPAAAPLPWRTGDVGLRRQLQELISGVDPEREAANPELQVV
jgi:hypothetical protein